MSTPTTNSSGNLVWKPQVGIYAKPAENQRESYGGVIGALQDVAVDSGFNTKSFPHNFAGIIAAIQDLSIKANLPPVQPGPNPGNGAINENTGDWEEVGTIEDGRLWFDTRQGRLFVRLGNDWIQTNGADGLALITDTTEPPVTEDTPALGQFWFSQQEGQLYIHDGNYIDSEGNIVPSTDPGAMPLWRLINSASDGVETTTTATVALAGNPTQRIQTPEIPGDIIQAPDLNTFHTQQDYNVWSVDNLLLLEEAVLNKSDVVIGDTAPANPSPGLLWYDTSSLDLSIYYVDEDGDAQWVPTTAQYTYDAELDNIRASIISEKVERESQIQNVEQTINNLNYVDQADFTLLQQNVSVLQTASSDIAAGNYQTSNAISEQLTTLHDRINSIPAPCNLEPYAKTEDVQTISNKVDALPTNADLDQVRSLIPNVESYLVQQQVDDTVAAAVRNCLPRSGGEINGRIIVNKTDYDAAALDFSVSAVSSHNAFKFQSLGSTGGNYVTFGNTETLWEQAWKFAGEEDFCWIYNDANKVFSISKEGPACSQLYIGDFAENDENGRVMSNRIDVRDRLTAYQSAFNQMRHAISNSTDYESLRSGLLTAIANV